MRRGAPRRLRPSRQGGIGRLAGPGAVSASRQCGQSSGVRGRQRRRTRGSRTEPGRRRHARAQPSTSTNSVSRISATSTTRIRYALPRSVTPLGGRYRIRSEPSNCPLHAGGLPSRIVCPTNATIVGQKERSCHQGQSSIKINRVEGYVRTRSPALCPLWCDHRTRLLSIEVRDPLRVNTTATVPKFRPSAT